MKKREIAAAVVAAKKQSDAELAPKVTQAQARHRVAEQQLETLKTQQEEVLVTRLTEQCDALNADKDQALSIERAKAFGQTQKLIEKVAALQRQLENKTAEELGEGAEVDLFEELKFEFAEDNISRVAKGEAGADIIHTVMVNGRECGKIVYDSKNRQAWRSDYVSKLRKDQLAAKADHAILVSCPFPSGSKQLHVHDSVIVVHPARIVALMQIIRDQVVMVAGLRISEGGRAQKMSTLYDFITSNQCNHLLDQVDQLSDDLLELDVKEKKNYDSTWRKRGELVKGIQQARSNLVSAIGLIVNVDSDPA